MVKEAVDAWAALLRVHGALVPALDRELQTRAGMPLTWYDVLLELNYAPGRALTMGELGERAVLSRSRVSRVVDDLVYAGLVERQPNPSDRRSAKAAMTDAGRSRFRRAAPVYVSGIQQYFGAHLRGREAAVIARALQRVLDAGG